MRLMLAATCQDINDLRYPLYASTKLDGIRAVVLNGVVLSRTMKPIPNPQVQKMFRKLEGLDGELIVGDPTADDCYRRTMSHCMSKSGEIEGLSFYGFDVTPSQFLTFKLRHQSISDKYRLPHVTINSPEELATYEEAVVGDGYEGVITRNPYGSYKQGRSTMTEQGMVKVKRFLDDEAKIVGFEERMHNGNEATTDARGYTVHTSHKANQVPTNALGSLIVTWKGKEFNIGTGFTELERHTMWLNKKFMVGKIVKFKYLPVGMKDLPRHPVFLGMRPEGA